MRWPKSRWDCRRFREKYAAKMNDGPDRRAFEVVTAPIGSASKEFRAVATAVANINTLDAFLRDMRKRYPEKEQLADVPAASAPETQPAKGETDKPTVKADGKAAASSAAPAKPPAGTPGKADTAPTGSISSQQKRLLR